MFIFYIIYFKSFLRITAAETGLNESPFLGGGQFYK